MEQVIKDGFGEIAARCDCCIELSQHTRKSTQGRQGELTADDMRWIREQARQGNYRHDWRSPDWIGRPLAQRLNLDPDDDRDRKRLDAVLRVWIANGVLAIETRKDEARRDRQYIIPGQWKDEE